MNEITHMHIEAKYCLNGLHENEMTYEQKQLRYLIDVENTPWKTLGLKRLSHLFSTNDGASERAEVAMLYKKISSQGIFINQHGLLALTEQQREKLQQDPFSEPLYKALKWLQRITTDIDGRLRTPISPYHSITGRAGLFGTTPINGFKSFKSQLITAPNGYCALSVDYSACEVGILAALSGDKLLQNDYSHSEDFYAVLLERLILKEDLNLERSQIKLLMLMSIYGASQHSIGDTLHVSETISAQLQNQLFAIYPQAFTWLHQQTITSYHSKRILSQHWQIYVSHHARPTQVRNWPIQMMGVEIINLASQLADAAGLKIIGLVHDCIYIESTNESVRTETAKLKAIMASASQQLLGGFELKTDVDFTTQH
ncbi:DNA polymerase [Vibrio vulnificus]|nr:DNA polymerase [Vibrio vulnificus]